MLPTPFEMLVRSPILLVLPYAQAHADQNCQNMSLNYFCMSHVGSMLAKCASYAYTFRVPGPVFKAGLIFLSFLFSCTFFPFQHTKGVDDAQIRQCFCCIASFFGSCTQLRDAAGPNIFQITENKLLTFAARFSHRFQQGRCCPNPTQYCLCLLYTSDAADE